MSQPESTPKKRTRTKKTASSEVKTDSVAAKPGRKKVRRVASNDSVLLPSNMSLRARERSLVERFLASRNIAQAAYRIAYVSSFMFVLLGLTLIAQGQLGVVSPLSQGAQTTVVDPTISDAVLDPVTNLEPASSITYIEPEFSLLTAIPPELTAPLQIKFAAYNATDPSIMLVHDGNRRTLPVDYVGTETYVFEIPYHELQSGSYDVEVQAYDMLREPTKAERLGKFEIITQIEQPKFDLLSRIPSVPTDPFLVKFIATNVTDVKVVLISKDTDHLEYLVVRNAVADEYYAKVPVDLLDPARYRLVFRGLDLAGSAVVLFESNLFEIPEPVVQTTDTTTSVSADPVSADTTAVDTTSVDTASADPVVDADTESVDNTINTTAESVPVLPEATVELPKLTLTAPDGYKFTGKTRLVAKATQEIKFIELYARPDQVVQPQFIALGSYVNGVWQFVFDSQKLRNGTYNFFVNTKVADQTVRSLPVRAEVFNQPVVIDEGVVKVQPSDTETVTNDPAPETRPIEPVKPVPVVSDVTPPESTNREAEAPFARPPMVKTKTFTEADILLRENEQEVRALLRAYADAIRTGESETAKEIKQKLIRIAEDSSLDMSEGEGAISSELTNQITQTIEDLEDRIDRFERITKERTVSSVVDTDQDGISDHDEEVLYGTDPKSSDSDQDGISDADELERGFDPKNAAEAAYISYESPRDSLIPAREDLLIINRVDNRVPESLSPDELVVSEAENTFASEQDELIEQSNLPRALTEIAGTALPNSLVTLYIFSTPSVVTVRTDADGAFVYTFDKELEAGEHEVYVAVTDTNGRIVAQSNPFSFIIEQAQAFTATDATQAETGVADASVMESRPISYPIVVGIGILVFGLILFLIGISLRTETEEEESEVAKDDTFGSDLIPDHIVANARTAKPEDGDNVTT